MNSDADVARRQVTIVNTYGLHMRPSTRFVKLASTFQGDVSVLHDGRKANGKSVMDMLSLAAQRGQTLELEAARPGRGGSHFGPVRPRGCGVSHGRRGGLKRIRIASSRL